MMTGRITQQSIDEVLQLTDMTHVVGQVVKLIGRAPSMKGLCPFHNENTPSFTINTDQKVYYCHGCRAGGNAVQFVMETQSLSFKEAIEYMAQLVGFELRYEQFSESDQRRYQQERSRRGRLLECNEAANAWFIKNFHNPRLGREAKIYANRGRELSLSTLESFEVGFAPDSFDALNRYLQNQGFDADLIVQAGLSRPGRNGGLIDRFRNRLMYPIRNRLGDLVGFGGRALSADDNAKYLNSPDTWIGEPNQSRALYKKGDVVFGLDHVKRNIRRQPKGQRRVMLVEGNLDVMMLHQEGFDHAVCASGTKVTVEQLREIAKVADVIELVFDGDGPGRAATQEVIPRCIETGLDGYAVLLPGEIIEGKRKGDDPDSYLRKAGKDAFEQTLKSADDIITVWVCLLLEDASFTSSGKTRLLQKVGQILPWIVDPIRRELVVDQVRQLLRARGIEVSNRLINSAQSKRSGSHSGHSPRAMTPQLVVPEKQLEVVVTALRFPQLLTELRDSKRHNLLRHAALREALLLLAEQASAQPRVTPMHVNLWLQELRDDDVRQLLLKELSRPSPIDGTFDDLTASRSAHRHVVLLLDQLELQLLRQLLKVTIKGDQPIAKQQQIERQIRVLEKKVANFTRGNRQRA